jgi:hypothetical protein
VRFDGRRFEVLDMAVHEGMPANRIVSLKATDTGSLLFLTQQGHLGRVREGRSQQIVAPPAQAAEMLELLVERDGRLLSRSAEGKAWSSDGRLEPAARAEVA